MSRRVALEFSKRKDLPKCVIISIQESGQGDVQFAPNLSILATLNLKFDDVLPTDPEGHAMLLEDAQAIYDFVNIWRHKVHWIIVHCHAGISRSAGVASGISLALNSDDKWVWENNKYTPNTYCYKLVLQAFGIGKSEEEVQALWEKLLDSRKDGEI